MNVGLVLSAPGPATVIGNALALASLVIQGTDAAPAVTLASVQLAKIKSGKHKTATVIVVQFSGGIWMPPPPDNLANFQPRHRGQRQDVRHSPNVKQKSGGTGSAATYNAAAHTVTLTPRKPLVLNPSLLLSINASGLTDAAGPAP